ncbi:MAG TPA: hypothetical protein VM695_10870 [Phycisphaerae bacterium]|nr:hypothetical protein [Phycisphaerae bacterium]
MDDERGGEALVGPEGPDPRFGEGVLRWIERHELQGPAAVVLELHRPLMPLAWTAAVLAGAFVAPLFGPDYYRKIEALRDPALLDRMIRRLESSAPNPPTS